MLLNNKQIFIVEDNLQNRVVFQMALVMNGAKVEFERWGHGAIARLKTLRDVHLIILDLTLFNGTSGYDVFTDIRALPQYDKVPIIAVSAVEPAIAIPKTQQMGFSGFIAKPIDDELFPQQIVKILEGNPVWYGGVRYHGVSS
jgi:two-component system, cell cycle response regulator DivK